MQVFLMSWMLCELGKCSWRKEKQAGERTGVSVTVQSHQAPEGRSGPAVFESDGFGPSLLCLSVLWLSDPFIQQGLLRRLLMGPIDILCFTLDLLSPLQDKDTWSDLTPSLTSGLNWIFVSSFSFF